MSRPSILFVCNAGPSVGGGHVMRCLTLAEELAFKGVRPAFLETPEVKPVLDAFAHRSLRRVTTTEGNYDLFAFDHYGLTAPDHRRLAAGRPVLVIDDLADRPLGADLVLDSGPARRPEDYAGLVPEAARLLLGPMYAPVRPDFVRLSAQALQRRAEDRPVERILVSLGLTDVGRITAEVLVRLLPLCGQAAVDVVLGAAAPSLPAVQARAANDPRLVLHIDTRGMADLMLRADLAIGGAGSTAWERCTLGLPTVQVVLADNQRGASDALAKAGAVLAVDRGAPTFLADLDTALLRLLQDAALRGSLSRAAARICDGMGALRVGDAVVALLDRAPTAS